MTDPAILNLVYCFQFVELKAVSLCEKCKAGIVPGEEDEACGGEHTLSIQNTFFKCGVTWWCDAISW